MKRLTFVAILALGLVACTPPPVDTAQWPVVAGSPVSTATVGNIRAWVLEFCKIEAADPEQAAQLRVAHGFRAEFDLFKCDNAFPGLGFTN